MPGIRLGGEQRENLMLLLAEYRVKPHIAKADFKRLMDEREARCRRGPGRSLRQGRWERGVHN